MDTFSPNSFLSSFKKSIYEQSCELKRISSTDIPHHHCHHFKYFLLFFRQMVGFNLSNDAWEIPWAEEPGGLQFMGLHELGMTRQLNTHSTHYAKDRLLMNERLVTMQQFPV